MRKIVFKCDKCGVEQEIRPNENGSFDYSTLTINNVKLITDGDHYETAVPFELCSKCYDDLVKSLKNGGKE